MRRTVARTVAGVSGVVLAQAGYLAATYVTPGDSKGPFAGLHKPEDASWHLAHCQEARTTSWSVSGRWTRPWRRPLFLEPRARELSAASAETEVSRPPALRVLILGDSLVSGVGSDIERAPPLPERLAQVLAERLGRPVSWKAVGITGADVATLREAVLPAAKADAIVEPPAVVVLLCGLNDFKRLLRGRTPAAFREELRGFLSDLRALAGPNALLVLPGLPIHATQRFPTPLHQLACLLATAWDAQKEALATLDCSDDRVVYIQEPRLSLEEGKMLVCDDGVHPNGLGYALWGEHIAGQIVHRMQAAAHMPAMAGWAASRLK
jgi:lysophospholipase L1-like esterase